MILFSYCMYQNNRKKKYYSLYAPAAPSLIIAILTEIIIVYCVYNVIIRYTRKTTSLYYTLHTVWHITIIYHSTCGCMMSQSMCSPVNFFFIQIELKRRNDILTLISFTRFYAGVIDKHLSVFNQWMMMSLFWFFVLFSQKMKYFTD